MRTAENIIKEYLDRGYGLESLRVLAESRSEPLCSEMLALLRDMEAENAAEVACEPEVPAAEAVIFFVADDDEAVAGEHAVDFNVMSGPDSPPASLEESVADIFIGETDGSDIMALTAGDVPEETDDSAPESAVWSRRWQAEELQPAAESAALPNEASDCAGETAAPYGAPETPAAEQYEFAPRTMPALLDSLAAQTEISSDYLPGSVIINPETDEDANTLEAVAETPAPAEIIEETMEAQQESEAVREPVEEAARETVREPEQSAAPEPEPAVSEEPAAADAPAALPEAAPEPAAQAETPVEATLPAPLPPPPVAEMEKKESRRERRRRDRAEKKKMKKKARADSALTAHNLPEIVLTRSEGTDILMPETADLAGQTPQAALPAPEPEAASETPAPAAEETAAAAAPEMDDSTCPVLDEPAAAGAQAPELDDSAALADSARAAHGEKEETTALSEPEAGHEAQPEADDHAMIIATGGLDLRSEAYRLLAVDGGIPAGDLHDYEPGTDAADQGKVILFRSNYPAFDFVEDEETVEMEETPRLRMLSLSRTSAEGAEEPADAAEPAEIGETADSPDAGDTASEPVAQAADIPAGLSPMARLGLLRAVSGLPEADGLDAEPAGEADHVIMAQDPEEERQDLLAAAIEAREEMERDYQTRLDEFAGRLLDLQATVAAKEAAAREKGAEIQRKDNEIEDLRKSVTIGDNRRGELSRQLDETRAENKRQQGKLEEFKEMLGEHERLYKEFEDLRQAYNEVVTDVMPALQNERDDLALTVERQCESEDTMRSSLGSARRRLAVGYGLATAACAMLVALPVFNWLRSGGEVRDLAVAHQQIGELRELLDKSQRLNVKLEQEKFDIEHKSNMVLAELQEKTKQLAKQTDKHAMELALQRSGHTAPAGDNGTPIRVSDMALAGPSNPNAPLRYNDVRDPAGSIESVLEANRSRRGEEERAPSRSLSPNANARVAANTARPVGPAAGTGLRPPAAGQTAAAAQPASRQVNDRPAAAATLASAAKPGETTAKVKQGEGVAQIVFRVLGTRDPEVINWVIRENNIKKDRRGNPLIYPEQELRLPQEGRTSQSANAARR